MRGTHWGQGYNRPTGCSAEKAPHATFNFFFYKIITFSVLLRHTVDNVPMGSDVLFKDVLIHL